LRKSAGTDRRIGVAVRGDGIAVAVIRRTASPRPILERCELLPSPVESDPKLRSEQLRNAGLPAAPVSSVLAAGQYQFALVDAPDVPAAELRAAMRWRLREVIDYPVDDAVIDVFDVPRPGRGSNHRTVYAVASRRSVVEELSAGCSWNGRLDVVDVPELVLRNLTQLVPESAGGVALLHVEGTTATAVLARDGTFHLSRQIALHPSLDLDAGDAIDGAGVALELQRSLDYYERQFDLPPISRIFVAPPGPRERALADALAIETGLTVTDLDLNQLLECAKPIPAETQRACLLAVGAALRFDPVSL